MTFQCQSCNGTDYTRKSGDPGQPLIKLCIKCDASPPPVPAEPKPPQQCAPLEIEAKNDYLTDVLLQVALVELGWLIQDGTLHAPSDRLAFARGCRVSNPVKYASGYAFCLNCIRDNYSRAEISSILKKSNNLELIDRLAGFEIDLIGYDAWLKQSGLRRVHKLSSHPDFTRRELRKLREPVLSDAQVEWADAEIKKHPAMEPMMMLAIELYLAGLLIEKQEQEVIVRYIMVLANLLDISFIEMEQAWNAHEQLMRLSYWRLRSMKRLWATLTEDGAQVPAAYFPELIERIEALHNELASIPRDDARQQIDTSLRGFKVFDWMQFDVHGPARHNKGG